MVRLAGLFDPACANWRRNSQDQKRQQRKGQARARLAPRSNEGLSSAPRKPGALSY